MPNLIEDLKPSTPPTSPSIATPANRGPLRGPVTGVTRIGSRAGLIAAGGAAALVVGIFYGISSSGNHRTPVAHAPLPQALSTSAPSIDGIPGAIPSTIPMLATPKPHIAAPAAAAPAAPAPIVLPAQPANAPQTAAVPTVAAALPVPAPLAVATPNARDLAVQAAAQLAAAQAQARAEAERAARQAAIVVPIAAAVPVAAAPVVAAAAPRPSSATPSPYTLQTGSVIPATLVSGINSDLAGTIVAQVNQDVYDSKSGRYVLIPAGAKLIGKVDAQVLAGGSRVQVGWNRIIFPDATSVDISGATGSDGAGYAGLTGNVDDHQNHSVLRTALTSILGIGAALLQPRAIVVGTTPSVIMQAPTPVQQAAAAAGTQATQAAATQLNAQNAGRAPTVEVQPGTVFNVMVGHDVAFAGPAKR